jgi:hypothetical protein
MYFGFDPSSSDSPSGRSFFFGLGFFGAGEYLIPAFSKTSDFFGM